VFMGASLNPKTDDPEFVNTPRHEFNLWFDPEAAHVALMAPWKKIVCTTVDISVKTRLTQDLIDRIKKSNAPAARYIGAYARISGQYNYLWDEIAALAWLEPTLITAKDTRYLDVDLNRGAGFGDTLSWSETDKPQIVGPPAEIQVDLNLPRFYREFVALLSAPTPKPQ
jgi:purine nucleosidase